jgi:Ca-activated chloride channel family protein
MRLLQSCPSRRVLAAAILAVVGAGGPVAAQQPNFRSSTQIVSLFATVTDSENRLVPDLTRDDFQVLDNEKPQQLVVFENQNQPITVVVMLDTSASMTGSIKLLKDAAEQFVMRLLPEDKAAVGAFNDKIELSAQFSNDRDQLVTEIRDLDFGNGTRLYDAVAEGLNQLQGVEGRKVILVFTDGDDTSSRVGRGTVMDRARAEEVMIYAIGLQSEFMGQRTKPDSGLRRLADETGGGYFELKAGADLGPTFTRVAQELHSQYALGFEAQVLDGKIHKLVVKMKQAGMTARARRSYLASAATPSGK